MTDRPEIGAVEITAIAAIPHPSVTLHVHPDDATLAALLAEAWVFCYPSIYEGFGIPYIEAMAAGTAIVTSPNAGAGEVLKNGRYGIICDDDHFADDLSGTFQAALLPIGTARIILDNDATVIWTYDNWAVTNTTETIAVEELALHYADLPAAQLPPLHRPLPAGL